MLIAQMVDFTAVYVGLAILAAGLLAGLLSIGASIFVARSRFGAQAGKVALGVGVGSPPVFWLLAGNSLIPEAYAVLALPALVGAVGIGLSRLPAGRTLTAIRATIVLSTCVAVTLLGYWWWQGVVAGREMMELLGGSAKVQVVAFEVNHQQRRVVCDDRVVCDYLTTALRQAKPPWSDEFYGRGSSYTFTLRFASGSSYEARVGTHRNGLSLSIPEANPAEAGYDTHSILFDSPIPARLSEIWSFLEKPYEEVAGSVMVVADEKPTRFDYDASLDSWGAGPLGR